MRKPVKNVDNQRNKANTRNAETKLYECLGVKTFRKLIFILESFRHRKDKSKNINYHLRDSTISSMANFTGYLLYNTACHAISLVLVAVYFCVTCFMGLRYLLLDVPMGILVIVNLYCIMLQRYTYIKIQTYAGKRIEARNNQVEIKSQCLKQVIENRDKFDLQEEYKLIKRIWTHVQDGTDCFLSGADAPTLNRLAVCVKDILKTPRGDFKSSCNRDNISQIISRIPKQPLVVATVDQRTARLQNILHSEKRNNLLFGFSIITETYECENAYKRLIPGDSRDSVEFALDVLLGAYNECSCIREGGKEKHEKPGC